MCCQTWHLLISILGALCGLLVSHGFGTWVLAAGLLAVAGMFWVGNAIWTTKRGLEKRSLELKELREVKIPENQDAIGRAAAFGDLSENSEWEAAMEEQRNLTARAMAIEEELRQADLIEEAALPEGTICPGARVDYR